MQNFKFKFKHLMEPMISCPNSIDCLSHNILISAQEAPGSLRRVNFGDTNELLSYFLPGAPGGPGGGGGAGAPEGGGGGGAGIPGESGGGGGGGGPPTGGPGGGGTPIGNCGPG